MFKILKDQNAASKDLAETYVQAVKLEEAMATEKGEIHRKLMELQVDSFDRKPSKELQSVKTAMDNLNIRLEAVQFGKQELKTRIGERLQKEAQDRLEEIEKELSNVSTEEKELQEVFLSTAAKAAVIREQIKGQALTHDNNGNYRVCISSLEVKINLMDNTDGAFYSERVKHYRQESPAKTFGETIRGRESSLVEEQTRLQKMLEGDPQEETERLLSRLIPSKPEPTVVTERPKSHPSYESRVFTRDYDKIGPVDYGEGESLPYRGISEIVAERKEAVE